MVEMRAFHKRYDYIVKQISSFTTIKQHNIVDCGCGVGDGTKHLAKEGGEVIGIDIDKNNIITARKTFANIKFMQGSILSIELEEFWADVFVCSETLEHLSRKNSLLAAQEIKRVCKQGAYICITVPNTKKACMANQKHKQYLSVDDIVQHFPYCSLIYSSVFYKSINKNRGNRVVILRKN